MSLRVHQLSRQDGSTQRLNNVTLNFQPGELCVIAGPNGSGKSTLLDCLSAQLKPSQGRISFGDRDLQLWSALALAQRRAVMAQHVPTHLPMSVCDVVALGALPHQRKAEPYELRTALGQVGLLNQFKLPYNQLSGGQQARVQLARHLLQLAPAQHTAIFLLDEPIASLDPYWQHHVLRLLKQKTQLGWTVVCVLHDLNLAAQYADRLVILDQGRVALDGPALNILTQPKLDQIYQICFHRIKCNDGLMLRA